MWKAIVVCLLIVSIGGIAIGACSVANGASGEDAFVQEAMIEDVILTYAVALETTDKDLFLSILSDDLEVMASYKYGEEAPELFIPMPDEPGTPKEQLGSLLDMVLVDVSQVSMVNITNIQIDLDGNRALASDHFQNWSIPNMAHPLNASKSDTNWYFGEGKHEWELLNENGEWKVIKLTVTDYRSEVRPRQDI